MSQGTTHRRKWQSTISHQVNNNSTTKDFLQNRQKNRQKRKSLYFYTCFFLLLEYLALCFTCCNFSCGLVLAASTNRDDFGLFNETLLPPKRLVRRAQQSLHEKNRVTPIVVEAGRSAIDGGLSGAIAGAIQVLTLMWLRTVINYQCRYGTTFRQALFILYNQGGVPRFYHGLAFALLQAPLSKFVSTAAYEVVQLFGWGTGKSTIVASVMVGFWRMILMPIDTCKTVLQVDSAVGFRQLMKTVRAGKIRVLYQGAFANAVSAIASHYPWYYTYNYLSKSLFVNDLVSNELLRNAGIGFMASIVSGTITNALRVIKTTKQAVASKHSVSYGEAISMILAASGWKGLFGRGLKTRILANGVQSVVFVIIWRGLAERWGKGNGTNETNSSSIELAANNETGRNNIYDNKQPQ